MNLPVLAYADSLCHSVAVRFCRFSGSTAGPADGALAAERRTADAFPQLCNTST